MIQDPIEVSPSPLQLGDNTPKRGKKGLIAVFVVVVLALGAYVAYAQYYLPKKAWDKFTSSEGATPEIYKSTFTVGYTDKGKLSPEAESQTPFLRDVKLEIGGEIYTDERDMLRPAGTMDLKYSIHWGDSSLSSKANLIMKDNIFFINPGDLPQVAQFMAMISPQEKFEWLKLDTVALASFSGGLDKKIYEESQAKIAEETKKLLEKYRGKLVRYDKFLGTEKIRGIKTFHLKNTIDKAELKNFINELLGLVMSSGINGLNESDRGELQENAAKFINIFLDKIQVNNYETWIGQNDFKLHKDRLEISFPSLAGIASKMAEEQNKQSLGDAEEFLRNLPMEAVLAVETENYDFGKEEDIKLPEKSFDLMQILQAFTGGLGLPNE